MSDFLSQDQIDSLINEANYEGGSDGGDGAEGGDIRETLANGCTIFAKHAGSVIGQVINKQLEFSVNTAEVFSDSSMKKLPGDEHVLISIPFNEGPEGSMYLVMDKADVARFSDLMLMGDGTGEFVDDHLDAMSELVSQVMGAFSTDIMDQTGNTINSKEISAALLDASSLPVETDTDYSILLDMVVEEEHSAVALLMKKEVAQGLVNLLPAVEADSDGEFGISGEELNDLSAVSQASASAGADQARSSLSASEQSSVEMLLDVELDISIELGRTDLALKRILELGPGSIVELDKMAGEPVDLLVNGKVVAKGEVVVVDENFGIRLVSLVSPEERIRSLR